MPCYICRTTLHAYINKENNVRLHVFPTSRPLILEEWKKFACVPEGVDTHRLTLCTKHFRKEDVKTNPLKITLSKTAIPCLYAPGEFIVPSDDVSVLRVEEVHAEKYESSTTEDATAMETEEGLEEVLQEYPNGHPIDEGYQAVENVKNRLCRICGKKEDLLLQIFEPHCKVDVPMSMKIDMYLPVKVEENDGLPSKICSLCAVMVNRWHELNVTCLSADAALRKIFCSAKFEDEATPDGMSNSTSKYSDEDVTDVYFVDKSESSKNDDSESVHHVIGNQRDLVEEEINESLQYKNIKLQEFPPGEEHTVTVVPSLLPCCCYCRETFDFYDDRRSHLAECRELPAVCEFCGLEVPQRKLLSKHKLKHINRKKYSRSYMCDKCARCLCSAQALEYHRAVVHSNKGIPKYYCELCCKVMYTKPHYESHLKSHAAGRIKSKFKIDAIIRDKHSAVYACPVCKQTFRDKLNLVVHLTSKKSVTCPKCRVRLRSEKKVLFHRCKKWHCGYCSKTFSSKKLLADHEKQHIQKTTNEDKVMEELE